MRMVCARGLSLSLAHLWHTYYHALALGRVSPLLSASRALSRLVPARPRPLSPSLYPSPYTIMWETAGGRKEPRNQKKKIGHNTHRQHNTPRVGLWYVYSYILSHNELATKFLYTIGWCAYTAVRGAAPKFAQKRGDEESCMRAHFVRAGPQCHAYHRGEAVVTLAFSNKKCNPAS